VVVELAVWEERGNCWCGIEGRGVHGRGLNVDVAMKYAQGPAAMTRIFTPSIDMRCSNISSFPTQS
jgi:hypothetical protein